MNEQALQISTLDTSECAVIAIDYLHSMCGMYPVLTNGQINLAFGEGQPLNGFLQDWYFKFWDFLDGELSGEDYRNWLHSFYRGG